LEIVPSSAWEPSSTFVPSSIPILVSNLDDDSEDENPPPPTDLPLDEAFETKQAQVPPLP
jgi:hypothetical protein